MTAHHCHAEGCSKNIPPKRLMCGRHWRKVPQPIQRLIWLYYRVGQEVRKDPSRAYMAAQRLAVAAVAAQEKKVGVATVALAESRQWATLAGPAVFAAIGEATHLALPAESAQVGLFGGA